MYVCVCICVFLCREISDTGNIRTFQASMTHNTPSNTTFSHFVVSLADNFTKERERNHLALPLHSRCLG